MLNRVMIERGKRQKVFNVVLVNSASNILYFHGTVHRIVLLINCSLAKYPNYLNEVYFFLYIYSGANMMIGEHFKSMPGVLAGCVNDPTVSEEPCHKETGGREGLHMRSRGYFFIITSGGFIETFSPLFRFVA